MRSCEKEGAVPEEQWNLTLVIGVPSDSSQHGNKQCGV